METLPKYLKKHRTGYKYQQWVPEDVRPYIGTLSGWWRHYISGEGGEVAVLEEYRAYRALYKDRIAAVRAAPEDKRAQLAADGGLDKATALAGVLPALERLLAEPGQTAQRISDRIQKYLAHTNEPATHDGVPLASPAGQRLLQADVVSNLGKLRDQYAKSAAAIELTEADAASDMNGLLALWIKRVEPKCVSEHYGTVALFTSVVGTINYRKVTREHIAKFRDHIETDLDGNGKPRTKRNQTRQIERLSALFTAAVDEQKIKAEDHPLKGVAWVRGKKPRAVKRKYQPLTGAQTRLILDKAAADNFGGERHEAALWVLKVCAWTGARPSEVCQLQRGDVKIIVGVPVISINEICAQTGKGFPTVPGERALKSLKNEESGQEVPRMVPLHPALYDADYQREHNLTVCNFLDFAKGPRGEYVFAAFKHNRQKGRYHWFGSNFGPFLADIGIIADPGFQVSLYSWRHGFHRFMRRAGIDRDLQRVITGHASPDEHGKYGAGDELRALARAMATVNVLAD